MTPAGSFATCRLSAFAQTLSEADTPLFRGACIKSGFESVAIIPVRCQGRTVGAIHLADTAPERLPLRVVELIEALAPLIGSSLHRLKLEGALRQNAAALARAEQVAHLGHYEFAVPKGAVQWSEETFRIVGRDPAAGEPTVEEYMQVVFPEDRGLVSQVVMESVVGKHDFNFEYRIVRPDGAIRYVQSVGGPILDESGTVARIFGTLLDVTARKEAELALQASSEQLRALAASLQAVREEERTSIAREIHDVLAQELTILKVDVALMKRLLSGPEDQSQAERVCERLVEMAAVTDRAIQMVQKIATDLRPAVLDALGLCAAIEWQAKDFRVRTGLECHTKLPAADPAPDRECSTAVFRILQESLTNIIRHAGASRVDIGLESDGQHLTLTVRDNGRGVGEKQAEAPGAVGLLGMRERAALLGGWCGISGRPGEGTTVEARIPLSSAGGPKEPTT